MESACNEVVGGRKRIRYMREFVIAVKRLNSVPLCHQGARHSNSSLGGGGGGGGGIAFVISVISL